MAPLVIKLCRKYVDMSQSSGTPYVNILLLTTSSGQTLVFVQNTMQTLQHKCKVLIVLPQWRRWTTLLTATVEDDQRARRVLFFAIGPSFSLLRNQKVEVFRFHEAFCFRVSLQNASVRILGFLSVALTRKMEKLLKWHSCTTRVIVVD